MDSTLFRERAAFKRKASANPILMNKKYKENDANNEIVPTMENSSKTTSETAIKPRFDANSYKYMTEASNNRLCVLTKIVQHLKALHLDGEGNALTLEEILDQTKQLNVSTQIIEWLRLKAFVDNLKIEATPDGKFRYKPTYEIRNKKALLKLLKLNDLQSRGGIFLSDVEDSLPNHKKILKLIDKDVWTVTRPADKKKMLFFNDKSSHLTVDRELSSCWRAVAVDAIDDNQIEEYLMQQGIRSMQGSRLPLAPKQFKRKKITKRKKQKPLDNEHLKDILKDYDTEI